MIRFGVAGQCRRPISSADENLEGTIMRPRITVALSLATAALGQSGAQAADRCSRIVDPAARLACYDARNGAPAESGQAAPSAAPAPVARVARPPKHSRE